jgi:hypothetical protein
VLFVGGQQGVPLHLAEVRLERIVPAERELRARCGRGGGGFRLLFRLGLGGERIFFLGNGGVVAVVDDLGCGVRRRLVTLAVRVLVATFAVPGTGRRRGRLRLGGTLRARSAVLRLLRSRHGRLLAVRDGRAGRLGLFGTLLSPRQASSSSAQGVRKMSAEG